jgi:hypothetical protein
MAGGCSLITDTFVGLFPKTLLTMKANWTRQNDDNPRI